MPGKDQKTVEKKHCHHCGSACEDEALVHDEHHFCCSGCAMVYDILKENDLCKYYDLEKNPGTTFQTKENPARFDYLDDHQTRDALLEFHDEEFSRVHFNIPQIHCQSCLWLLEKLPKLAEGIRQSRVNFLKKEVTVTFTSSVISLKEVVALLSRIGYEPEIRLDATNEKVHKPFLEKTWVQLGITGFCFGNIMLLAFPEYVSGGAEIPAVFRDWFGWISLFLSLPALYFGGKSYFVSAFLGLKNRGINIDVPISLGIISLFFASLGQVVTNQGPGYFDSLAGLLFFLLLGKTFQQKTFHRLSFERDFKAYFPLAVTRLLEGKETSVPVTKLEPGDRLRIRHQELIPADSILLTSHAKFDYSFVTGEAHLVEKVAGEKLYAGGRLSGAAIEVEVLKKPSQSYLTNLWNEHATKNTAEEDLGSLTNRISSWFTIAVLSIAVGAALYWIRTDFSTAMSAFTSVLIIACPCALALAVPFTFGNVLRLFGRHKFYLKNTAVVEDLAHIDHVIFDKTGTLTDTKRMRVDLEGALLARERDWVYSLASQSTHPLSKAVAHFLGGTLLPIGNFKEYTGEGLEGEIEGHLVRLGSGKFAHNHEMFQTDKTAVHINIDGAYVGRFVVQNAYRKGLKQAIDELHGSHSLSVLSGDSDEEETRLRGIFGENALICFKQSPYDKAQVIKNLQHREKQVLMMGDGLNDAGALNQSNVGIAITDDTTHFTPASDAILQADNFHLAPQFLKVAQRARKLVLVAFGLSFLYNLVGLFFAVQGLLSPIVSAILMPLSSFTVVGFAMISTTLLGRKLKS